MPVAVAYSEHSLGAGGVFGSVPTTPPVMNVPSAHAVESHMEWRVE